MNKIVSVLVGAVALAAIAPVPTLALLHAVGGTAQAQAPPTYWKVSMPDLGQHSDAWCWAGAAADSFWWFAVNQPGEDGLLGGVGHPWTNIEFASTNPPSVCWYDARDLVDGIPVTGYPTVLRKVAESTFMDADQDGIKDPGELNYCYAQGVEKWDYLIGLRDYVNNYGSNLRVHDIIDPAKCGVGTGFIVNRNVPTLNSRDPCSNGAGVPGVPGVDQVVLPPTFLDYQDELSAGQDVLLWMEPAPGYYFVESAHVVTGVGYNSVGGAAGLGTVTVADPWTHTTNPAAPPPPPGVPSGLHSDTPALLGPWQGKPDHNNSPSHGVYPASTDPYNLCDVISTAPFRFRCYNEDTGAVQPWQVVDMIFVSPLPPHPHPHPRPLPPSRRRPRQLPPSRLRLTRYAHAQARRRRRFSSRADGSRVGARERLSLRTASSTAAVRCHRRAQRRLGPSSSRRADGMQGGAG